VDKHDVCESSTQPTVVSLFSGAGGLDLGFSQAGFRLIYACDNDPAAVSVYTANLGPHIELVDVTDESFRSRVDQLPKANVVLGGFPCQGFSKAGPKRQDDKRNQLFEEMHGVVDHVRPLVFVAENVDGIVQNYNGHYLRLIQATFGELGYVVESRVLDAVRYGIPQHRRRTFFVGVREDLGRSFQWATPTHMAATRDGERNYDTPLWDWPSDHELIPRRTVSDAICDLVNLDSARPDHEVTWNWPKSYETVMDRIGQGHKLCNVRFSESSVHTWDIPEVYGHTTDSQRLILKTMGQHRRHKRYGDIPNGNPLSEDEITRLAHLDCVPSDLLGLEALGYVKRFLGGWDLKGAMFCSGLFKRPQWHLPAPTVLTNFHNPRYFIHPLRNRPFSVRECARLQGFDDDFTFSGKRHEESIVDKYRLVGNAVPPPLARALAFEVLKTIHGSE